MGSRNRYAKVCTCEETARGKVEVLPRLEIGHKSNRKEDLILRDYIVSAASQINAGGGSNNDNPTNLGVSDFSLVAATLDTNNAYKFMSGIEGEDKFGKMCAEVKSSLIDLEAAA